MLRVFFRYVSILALCIISFSCNKSYEDHSCDYLKEGTSESKFIVLTVNKTRVNLEQNDDKSLSANWEFGDSISIHSDGLYIGTLINSSTGSNARFEGEIPWAGSRTFVAQYPASKTLIDERALPNPELMQENNKMDHIESKACYVTEEFTIDADSSSASIMFRHCYSYLNYNIQKPVSWEGRSLKQIILKDSSGVLLASLDPHTMNIWKKGTSESNASFNAMLLIKPTVNTLLSMTLVDEIGAEWQRDATQLSSYKSGVAYSAEMSNDGWEVLHEHIDFAQISNVNFPKSQDIWLVSKKARTAADHTTDDFSNLLSALDAAHEQDLNRRIKLILADVENLPIIYDENLNGKKYPIVRSLAMPIVKSVKQGYLSAFSGMEEIAFGSTLQDISTASLRNCESLKVLDLSMSECTSVAMNLCSGCVSLEEVRLPLSVQEINEGAFLNCEALKEINLSQLSDLFYIKGSAFKGCKSLVSVVLPSRSVTLGTSVFEDCSKLKTAVITSSSFMTSANVFKACTSLDSVSVLMVSKLLMINSNYFAGIGADPKPVLTQVVSKGAEESTKFESLKDVFREIITEYQE